LSLWKCWQPKEHDQFVCLITHLNSYSLFNLSIFRIKKTIWKVLVVSSEAELVSAKELPKKAKRIPSLDIFRGLTVAVLLLPLHISLHCFFCLLLYIVVPACSKCWDYITMNELKTWNLYWLFSILLYLFVHAFYRIWIWKSSC
jgi:hypothetical protein